MARPQDLQKASKKEKSAKIKTAGLSEDRVVDSDSESDQKQVKTPVKAAEKVVEKKKTKTSTKKAAVPPPPPPVEKKVESSGEDDEDDEDSGSDSDDLDGDDESTASESGNVTATDKVNGGKRKAGEVSSSHEEESESGESLADITSQPAAKKAKTQQKPASPAEREEAAPPSAIPTTSFTTPKDFHPVDVAKFRATFPSDLSGKQIWHISAPSTLSLSQIKTIALNSIADGSTVLSHKGSDYHFSEDTSISNNTFSVLLPGKEGYRRSDVPVEKTLHLQQKIELPKLTFKQARTETGGEAAADVWKSVEEGARPQPKGMRMRYKPPGFGLGEPGLGSDDDEEDFKSAKTTKTKKTARRESGDAMEGVESTGKETSKEERRKAKKEAKAKAAL